MNIPTTLKPLALRRDVGIMLAGAILFVTLALLAGAHLPPAVDWDRTYRPATLALLRGESPYAANVGLYNPPWTLAVFVPFVMSQAIGRGALFVLSLVVYGAVAVRMGASRIGVIVFLISPPVQHSLLNGNVEWIVLAGLLLPPRWGLFAVAVKPQVAGGLAGYWTLTAWRRDGWRGVGRLIAPVALALLVSCLIFGVWPLRARHMPGLWWNAAIWPYGIPVGLLLVGYGISHESERAWLAAAPFLSPYVLLHAWAGAVLATVSDTRVLVVVVGLLWGFALLAA